MGLKTKQVKGPVSQAPLGPAHIAPQCGTGDVPLRGRISVSGVGSGVISKTKRHKLALLRHLLWCCGRGHGCFHRMNTDLRSLCLVHRILSHTMFRNAVQNMDCFRMIYLQIVYMIASQAVTGARI